MDLFEEFDINNAKFIHMAYWPQHLPYLDEMAARNIDISLSQTSTSKLGAAHSPRSPFLLKNPEIINRHIFDDNFIALVISNDDSGPLGIEDVWEEYLTVRNTIEAWYCEQRADLALIQFLRNSYQGSSPEQISQDYGLHKEALSWFMAYDLYEAKKELEDEQVRTEVCHRSQEILEKKLGVSDMQRRNFGELSWEDRLKLKF
jgi:hypothetical protein